MEGGRVRLAVMGREIRKERIREGRRNVLLGGVLAVVVLELGQEFIKIVVILGGGVA